MADHSAVVRVTTVNADVLKDAQQGIAAAMAWCEHASSTAWRRWLQVIEGQFKRRRARLQNLVHELDDLTLEMLAEAAIDWAKYEQFIDLVALCASNRFDSLADEYRNAFRGLRQLKDRAQRKEMEKIDDFPRQPGAYIFRLRERVLYVGESVDVYGRISAHLGQSSNERLRQFLRTTSLDEIDVDVHSFCFTAATPGRIALKRILLGYERYLIDLYKDQYDFNLN